MHRRSDTIWTTVVLAVGIVLVCASVFAGEAGRDATLVGTVVAVEWDEDDTPTGIELETEDRAYGIDTTGVGQKLLSHVGERVEVVGTVVEEEDWEYLEVTSFTVLPSEE